MSKDKFDLLGMNSPNIVRMGRNIVSRLHYIQKWRRGAKILMPEPEDFGKAIDDAIRYIRMRSKFDLSKDYSLTDELFLAQGYKYNTDSIKIASEYTQLISPDGLIVVSKNFSHTPNRPYYVSVDDKENNTVGGLDCGTICHFNSLLVLCEYKGNCFLPVMPK